MTERFETPRPVGSGLLIQPTGLAALERIGLRDAIAALGQRIDRLHGMTARGRTIFDLGYGRLGTEVHAIAVHRAALHGVLWDGFLRTGVKLTTGHEVLSPDDPILAGADFVVDASGTRSALRGRVVDKQPRPFPYGAVWTSVPDIGIEPATLAQRYDAARIMLGYLPVGRRTAGETPMAAIFWSIRNDQYDPWRQGFDAWKDQARAIWPALGPVLDGLDGPDDFTHATYVHFDTAKPWRDNLVLIGDSAHTTSPQLGQGANQALIDAVVLTDALAAAPDPQSAFALYARHRRSHVRFYQQASWAMTRFFQSDSSTLPVIRDLVFHPMRFVPWMHGEMLRTLSGLKTGLLTSASPDKIVNQLATP